MSGYTLCDHTGVPELAAQVTRLSNLAFAEYEGAMTFSEGWTRWYLRRPGTDPRMSQAALDGDRLVSQVIVCAQPVRLGGELLRCGIIDSVATDPEHRRRGLARALMERAHEAMRDAALDAAVLYTNPDDHPYRFYRRLGYQTRAQGAMLLGPRPGESGCGPDPVDAAEHAAALRRLVNDYHADWDGFSPLDDELWRWHKLDPPGDGPALVAEMSGAGPIATATFARAPVRIEGTEHIASVAYDVAAEVMNAEQLGLLLSSAPEEYVLMVLDEATPERRWAGQLGLKPQVSEVAMALPFSRAGEAAMEARRVPWYVMIESVVGV